MWCKRISGLYGLSILLCFFVFLGCTKQTRLGENSNFQFSDWAGIVNEQSPLIDPLTYLYPKGPVQKMEVYFIAQGKKELFLVQEFLEDGKIFKEYYPPHRYDGSTEIFTYDEYGRIKSSIEKEYPDASRVNNIYEYKYSFNSESIPTLIQEEYLNGALRKIFEEVRTKDGYELTVKDSTGKVSNIYSLHFSKGNLVEIKNQSRVFTFLEKYSYNKLGNIMERYLFYSRDIPVDVVKYTYDDKNQLVLAETFDHRNSPTIISRTEKLSRYDSHGNWLLNEVISDENARSVERVIEYY